jgi:hypothetical protein
MTTHETTAAEAVPESFEEIRRSLVELRASQRDRWARQDADRDRVMRELTEITRQQEATDRQLKETARRQEETARQQEETARQQEETARQQEETTRQQEETTRQMEATDRQMKATDRQMKATDRRLRKAEGLFTSDWGLLMESLVRGDLVALLRERGVHVNQTQSGRFRGRRNGEHFEVDILAENGREVVVVEVKTTLRPPHVKNFVSRLSEFEEWFPVYREKRVLGGMAYLQCDPSLRKHAERQGLFVIRATGSSASIVNAPDFKPRVFS